MALKRTLALFFSLLFATLVYSQNTSTKLIVFKGSDWCRNCIRFEKKVLKTVEFAEFLSKQHLEVEEVDFPQRKKLTQEVQDHNEAMANKYKFQGVFPTIILAKEDQIIHLKYTNQNHTEFIQLIEEKMLHLK